MPNGNGVGGEYVTWRGFVALGLPIVAIPIMVTWILLVAHASGTHEQAVRYKDLLAIEGRLDNIGASLREVRMLILQHNIHQRAVDHLPRPAPLQESAE